MLGKGTTQKVSEENPKSTRLSSETLFLEKQASDLNLLQNLHLDRRVHKQHDKLSGN